MLTNVNNAGITSVKIVIISCLALAYSRFRFCNNARIYYVK